MKSSAMYGKKSTEFLHTVKSKCMDSRERLGVQGMLRVSSVCELVCWVLEDKAATCSFQKGVTPISFRSSK